MKAAARIYNVSETTLRARKQGRSSRRDIPANLRKLTNSEESAIIQYIIDLDSRAFPPNLSAVRDLANLLLANVIDKRRDRISEGTVLISIPIYLSLNPHSSTYKDGAIFK